jgi:hypothetical protein
MLKKPGMNLLRIHQVVVRMYLPRILQEVELNL